MQHLPVLSQMMHSGVKFLSSYSNIHICVCVCVDRDQLRRKTKAGEGGVHGENLF